MRGGQVRVRLADAGIGARVQAAVSAAGQVDLGFDLAVTGPEGPAEPDAMWIAVVEHPLDGADAVRRGAVDAIAVDDLDRLPIAIEHARRALRMRALERLYQLSPDALEITDPDVR